MAVKEQLFFCVTRLTLGLERRRSFGNNPNGHVGKKEQTSRLFRIQ